MRGQVTSKNTKDGEYVTSTIIIPLVQTKDAEVYICTATNQVTPRPIVQEIELTAKGNVAFPTLVL